MEKRHPPLLQYALPAQQHIRSAVLAPEQYDYQFRSETRWEGPERYPVQFLPRPAMQYAPVSIGPPEAQRSLFRVP